MSCIFLLPALMGEVASSQKDVHPDYTVGFGITPNRALWLVGFVMFSFMNVTYHRL